MADNTEDNRKLAAEVLGIPAEEVLHYAVVAHTKHGFCVSFCGLSRNGITLLANAVLFLASEGDAVDASKIALSGGSGCDWPQEEGRRQ
jgi:hypothetical protein